MILVALSLQLTDIFQLYVLSKQISALAVQLCMERIPNKKKFSWWSMFHVNIFIRFGVMTVINRKPTGGDKNLPRPD